MSKVFWHLLENILLLPHGRICGDLCATSWIIANCVLNIILVSLHPKRRFSEMISSEICRKDKLITLHDKGMNICFNIIYKEITEK